MSDWKVTFWGVRGSIPVPGPTTVKYGGNTSCLEIRSDEGDWIIFDAGTGLRALGDSLDLSKKHEINLMISHPHWDHINGFPFFTPIYIPGNRVTVYGPSTFELTMEDVIAGQMKYSYFPVRTAELSADLRFRELREEEIRVGNYTVRTQMLNHPVTCLGYRVTYKGRVFIYLGDNEPYYNVFNDSDPETEAVALQMNERLVEFVRGADTLVADSQYVPAEYGSHKGWGHSHTHHVVNLALKAKVKHLFFFHHEPLRTDAELDRLVDHYRNKMIEKGFSLEIDAARERASFDL
ncbi:MAG: MBL fold metallo-hydrolase [Spirochaetes bacterium]|jgi:phosphoribosyl 1,2-cyclic phosphodiesterase|nr:MBL fold metallo-hydrolase [Spirochaetota bacterium]